MAYRDTFPIDRDNLPQTFEWSIGNYTYIFKCYLNDINDSIYVDLYDEDGVILVRGEKLVYGLQLFATITDPRIANSPLIPLDESGNETEVTFETLNSSVDVMIDNISPTELDPEQTSNKEDEYNPDGDNADDFSDSAPQDDELDDPDPSEADLSEYGIQMPLSGGD